MGFKRVTLKDLIIKRIFSFLIFVFLTFLFLNFLQQNILNPFNFIAQFSTNEKSLIYFEKELLMKKNFIERTFYDLNPFILYTRPSVIYGESVGKTILRFIPSTVLIILLLILIFCLYSFFWYKLVFFLINKHIFIETLSRFFIFIYSIPGFIVLIVLGSLIYNYFPVADFIFILISINFISFLGSLWVLNTFIDKAKILNKIKIFKISQAIKLPSKTINRIIFGFFLFVWLNLLEFFTIFLVTYGFIFIEYFLNIKGLGSILIESLKNSDIYLLKGIILLIFFAAFILNTILTILKLKLNPRILLHINNIWKF